MPKILKIIFFTIIVLSFFSCALPSDNNSVADTILLLETDIFSAGDSAGSVKMNLTLPVTNAQYGTTISWTSSDESIIALNGAVNRSTLTAADKQVFLSATVKKGMAKGVKEFELTVRKLGVRGFWVNDLNGTSQWTMIDTTMRYQTAVANVWVRMEDSPFISDALIREYGDFFTTNSYPDITSYVHPVSEFFGEPGNRINILFYHAQDEIAGYFWAKDFYLDEDVYASYRMHSNETNVFYINIASAVNSSDQAHATLFTKGTLTHEFQHMSQAHYFYIDSGEVNPIIMDTWANEMCSVIMESVHAGQADIYIDEYNLDDSGKFEAGESHFLNWPGGFTTYISASLYGLFIMSQMDSQEQEDFISTFLTHTGDGGTSIHDLVATLEDAAVGYWVSNTDVNADLAVQAKWIDLFKAFLQGLAGKNTAYNTFIDTVSSTAISPVFATTAGINIPLRASGFLIGQTTVVDMNSTDPSEATAGANDAYILIFHNGLPAYTTGGLEMPNDGGVTISTLVRESGYQAPASRSYSAPGFPYNRAMTPAGANRFMLPSSRITRGSRSGSRSIVQGQVQTFYVTRP